MTVYELMTHLMKGLDNGGMSPNDLVMVIRRGGKLLTLRDVRVEHHEDDGSSTVWLDAEEF